MSSMTPDSAEERRRLEEQDREDDRRLLDFCLTEDEYLETWRGNPPQSVITRRDRYYGRKQ